MANPAQDCGALEFGCQASQAASNAVQGWSESLLESLIGGLGKIMGLIGTWWVEIPSSNIIGGNGDDSRQAGTHAPVIQGIETTLGYAKWIALGIAVLSLIGLGVRFARARESSEEQGERAGVILLAVLLISGATTLVAAILPTSGAQGSGAVAYIANSLWWYTAGAAILSVIIGAGRMAWEQRANEGLKLLPAMLRLAIVSGAGITVVGLLLAAGDSYASWILQGSMSCDIHMDKGQCFGMSVLGMLGLTAGVSAVMPQVGVAVLITVVVLAFVTSLLQALMMLFRNGALAVLAGILPLSASATNTEMGKSWFDKVIGWIVGFLLLKPAAATVYATAFRLTGTNPASKGGDGLGAMLTGLALMVFALFTIGPLMRLAVPAVSAVTGGGNGASSAAMIAAAAAPTGARALGGLRSKLAARGASAGGGEATITPLRPSGSSATPTAIRGALGPGGSSPAALGAAPVPSGPPALPPGDGSGGGAMPMGGSPKPGPGSGNAAPAGAAAIVATGGAAAPAVAAAGSTGAAAAASGGAATGSTMAASGAAASSTGSGVATAANGAAEAGRTAGAGGSSAVPTASSYGPVSDSTSAAGRGEGASAGRAARTAASAARSTTSSGATATGRPPSSGSSPSSGSRGGATGPAAHTASSATARSATPGGGGATGRLPSGSSPSSGPRGGATAPGRPTAAVSSGTPSRSGASGPATPRGASTARPAERRARLNANQARSITPSGSGSTGRAARPGLAGTGSSAAGRAGGSRRQPLSGPTPTPPVSTPRRRRNNPPPDGAQIAKSPRKPRG